MFGVAGNALDAMMRASTKRALAAADIIVDVPLQKYGSLDWWRAADLIDEGYRAADAMRERLLPFALSEGEFERWRVARQGRRRTELPTATFIQLDGFVKRDTDRLNVLLARHVGVPLDVASVEQDIEIVAGLDRYETVTWRPVHDASRRFGLRVHGRVKPYAPSAGCSAEATRDFAGVRDAERRPVWI